MPRNGDMKAESKMFGRKYNIVICIDCICDRAIVENAKPTPRVATMNSTIAADSVRKLPNIGTSNSSRAAVKTINLQIADQHVRHDQALSTGPLGLPA